jgi:hypothetical protein
MTGSSAAALKAWKTRRKNGWVHPSERVEEVKPKAKAAPKAIKKTRTVGSRVKTAAKTQRRKAHG